MKPTFFSDKLLIEQYQKGDCNALNQLFERHMPKVCDTAFLLLQNKALAEDIAQDTAERALDIFAKGRYREGNFAAWLHRICHNLCIDYFRVKKRRPTISFEQRSTENGDANFSLDEYVILSKEEEVVRNEDKLFAMSLVERLPAEQREVVILRLVGSRSYKEIASITKVSINTSLGHMRYALVNLRRLMGVEKRQSRKIA